MRREDKERIRNEQTSVSHREPARDERREREQYPPPDTSPPARDEAPDRPGKAGGKAPRE
jgi:hypothetical protein